MARDSKSFGQRLKKLIKQARLSQQSVADALDIPRNTVWRWLNDKATPGSNNLQGLATLLHIPVDVLLNTAPQTDWVLTIRTADNFEEVINLTRNNFDCIAQLTTTKQGAGLLLTGSYEMFADNDKFKAFINQVKKARQIVLQNGEAMGWHKPKED